jgi:hypothetical protein
MPETAIDEDRQALAPKHDIRLRPAPSAQLDGVTLPETKSTAVQNGPDCDLRTSVAPAVSEHD